MKCGFCGEPAVRKLKCGLWRCLECYEEARGFCGWPVREVEMYEDEYYERPWLKWARYRDWHDVA